MGLSLSSAPRKDHHRRDQVQEWEARSREVPDGVCLSCAVFHTQTGFCSACSLAVHKLVGSQTLPSLPTLFATLSLKEVVDAASLMQINFEAAAKANLTATIARLDRAVQPAVMEPRIFAHLIRTLRAAPAVANPEELRDLLNSLGHPVLSALQAAEIIQLLSSRGSDDYKIFHVLCGRVVDQWNLTSEAHVIGHCYYGYWNPEWAAALLHITDAETLGAALCQMLEKLTISSKSENLADMSLLQCVKDLMMEHGVAFSDHLVYERFVS